MGLCVIVCVCLGDIWTPSFALLFLFGCIVVVVIAVVLVYSVLAQCIHITFKNDNKNKTNSIKSHSNRIQTKRAYTRQYTMPAATF